VTEQEATDLESEFGVRFPRGYRKAVTDGYPFSIPSEELSDDAESLRIFNTDCREEDPWGFPWRPDYWMTGGDGLGGFYFIDTREPDSRVFYCDHENMPSSMEDTERIAVLPFSEFLDEIAAVQEEMALWENDWQQRVANRRWWQFWIPRQWPPNPKS